MSDAFLEAWLATGREEGGYVDNPKDSGGPTNFGITERLARAYGYTLDMREFTQPLARRIAKMQFWDALKLDDVAKLSRPIASEVFDSSFLCGQTAAIKMLQRPLNLLNREGFDYGDIEADGRMGRVTLFALEAYLKRRGRSGESVLLTALNGEQYGYLTSLTASRPKDESFLFGWLAKRVQLAGL